MIECKVCGGVTIASEKVDFNKSCDEAKGNFLPHAGLPIAYLQCNVCKLLFTTAFDAWSPDDFKKNIYNEAYVTVDPDYVHTRPAYFAKLLLEVCRPHTQLKVLDYGGGNGTLATLLNKAGVDAASWDPMVATSFKPAEASYDLVTAFEVMEHTPAPKATATQAVSYLKADGVLLFSTHVFDDVPQPKTAFWYVAPRNGHITLHTRRSLALLFKPLGYKLHHFNDDIHLAYQTIPGWLDVDNTPFGGSGLRYKLRQRVQRLKQRLGI